MGNQNLTDVYNQIAHADVEILEKQAAQIKVAEEEDAAGRIMARGFADELQKLAGPYDLAGPGATGGNVGLKGRGIKAPKVKDISKGKGSFKPGSTVGAAGDIKPPPAPPKPVTPPPVPPKPVAQGHGKGMSY